MQVIRRQELIDAIATRWEEAYRKRGRWAPSAGGADTETIYRKLLALAGHPTEEQIAAIVGNREWTVNLCDECERDVDVSVTLGAEISHQVDAKNICLDCLTDALVLANASRSP